MICEFLYLDCCLMPQYMIFTMALSFMHNREVPGGKPWLLTSLSDKPNHIKLNRVCLTTVGNQTLEHKLWLALIANINVNEYKFDTKIFLNLERKKTIFWSVFVFSRDTVILLVTFYTWLWFLFYTSLTVVQIKVS